MLAKYILGLLVTVVLAVLIDRLGFISSWPDVTELLVYVAVGAIFGIICGVYIMKHLP